MRSPKTNRNRFRNANRYRNGNRIVSYAVSECLSRPPLGLFIVVSFVYRNCCCFVVAAVVVVAIVVIFLFTSTFNLRQSLPKREFGA